MASLDPIYAPFVPRSRAFLFRCWSKADAPPGMPFDWHLSVSEIGGEQRQRDFADLEALMDFIRLEILPRPFDDNNGPRASDTGDSREESRVALVEDGLKRLYDFLYLDEHPLAKLRVVELGVEARKATAASCLDRGKALSQVLVQALDALRPDGPEPNGGTIPTREWHPFMILRDSYVRGELNRSIMSRLYIGEGTFNRTRRRALRAVARALYAMEREAQEVERGGAS
jgi:hypothetical protein